MSRQTGTHNNQRELEHVYEMEPEAMAEWFSHCTDETLKVYSENPHMRQGTEARKILDAEWEFRMSGQSRK